MGRINRMGDIYKEMDLEYLADLEKCLRFFKSYEKKHYYQMGWVDFTDTIRLLEAELRGFMKRLKNGQI